MNTDYKCSKESGENLIKVKEKLMKRFASFMNESDVTLNS